MKLYFIPWNLSFSLFSDSVNFDFQELIAAFLACAFFCLFPVTDRGAKHLPTIDLDHLFEYVTLIFILTFVCVYNLQLYLTS